MAKMLNFLRSSHYGFYSRNTRRFSHSTLVYSEEVKCAITENKPIVALESTIITHGMPYPQNVETALEVENIIREQGAVPATIAILKGQLHIGLTKPQLENFGKQKGVIKTSRRDLAFVVADKLNGATTVAGTIIAAELADIPVFVTGGIGGVHRDGENTMDVSADLTELSRSKTLVVCSGVKSILDIGKTLEYLETHGVTVCAFGDSKEFPSFYTRRSGFEAPYNVIDATHAARVMKAARDLHLSSGIVVAVPICEKDAMNDKVIEEAIENALREANQRGIRGKEITPYLLAAVSAATGGASLGANIALIKNNAKVGADIAVQYQKLRNNCSSEEGHKMGNNPQFHVPSRNMHTTPRGVIKENGFVCFPTQLERGDVLVIGGANVDRTYRISEEKIQSTTYEALGCFQCDVWILKWAPAPQSQSQGVYLLLFNPSQCPRFDGIQKYRPTKQSLDLPNIAAYEKRTWRKKVFDYHREWPSLKISNQRNEIKRFIIFKKYFLI
ncbi:pseudouridine-5'-phosphate glycosidase isoform X2 [Leptidea sinapis]|uniref:pseudouridine-5'-phosphate glycosidase isoform X2 n=1 Tax=Leptidea sinapis TaxID=189913 RepID=UPI0021C25ED6|nr:pseudouridine-5'-phosphate glycosidase isoform X2 [Leptidea sinapis]